MTTYDLAESDADLEVLDDSLRGASLTAFWLEDPSRPGPLPALQDDVSTDLAVVGGGFTGLWTALLAKERDPGRQVVLVEGSRIGWAATGRNGGFCEASLTHGQSNGERHLPAKEAARLEELGLENLREIANTISRYGIDCDFEFSGTLNVATEEHQVAWLREDAAMDADVVLFDGQAVQQEVRSPLYLAGLWNKKSTALVNPAKLAWGLQEACLKAGVLVYENTVVQSIASSASAVQLTTATGTIRAQRAALATNVFPSLLKRTRLLTVPVYDYVLMTERLTSQQVESLGWKNGQGIADLNNRFHYYRLATDFEGHSRILFGGYDALYHFGGRLKPEYDQSHATFRRLSAHFFATFPQLAGIKFTHKWGGSIDTCSRFFSFFSTAHKGRVALTAGYTGLGVGASRFGANVMLDLLAGQRTERTSLKMVRKKPLPFPPEPLAWIGIKITTAAMIRADRNGGKRGLWLKAMDALGMGFDS
jgi:glycine/D-amino acid oxidase-like deaminating enzyme